MIKKYKGVKKHRENWSILPNEIIDMLPDLSESSLKCLLYIIRHTYGFQEFEEGKRITIDEFMNGRKLKNGTRMDKGTGLSKQSVINGLEKCEGLGLIRVEEDNRDLARQQRFYSLVIYDDNDNESDVKNLDTHVKNLDISGLNFGHRTEKETLETNLQKETSFGNASVPVSPSDEKKINPLAGFTLISNMPSIGKAERNEDEKAEPETDLQKLCCAVSGAKKLSGAQINRLNKPLRWLSPETDKTLESTLEELYSVYAFRQWVERDVLVRLSRWKKKGTGTIAVNTFIDAIEKVEAFPSWCKANPSFTTEKQETKPEEQVLKTDSMSMLNMTSDGW